jgi:alkylation response protein AidB-like acyl-CoA dehydrogenase
MPDVALTDDLDRFRVDVAGWLREHVTGPFADLAGRGGNGDEDTGFDVRVKWEQLLGEAGWIGLGWPTEVGGRGATIDQQVVWAEEYVRSGAPGRTNHIGEHLLGPTMIAFGSGEQKARFLPGILNGTERWCQGYSEPDAGSDLANVRTRAELDGDQWVINGQKIWTSLAHVAHWCFLLARTDPSSSRHRGLSFLLVPMDQPGITARRIVQITGGGEFNEVFFDDARTAADLVVGDVGQGWRTAMGLLGFERGVSTLAMQVSFERELNQVIGIARQRGLTADPIVRQRLVDAHTGLQIMRWNAQRSMSHKGVPGPESSLSKLMWGSWHPKVGNLAMDLLGPDSLVIAGPPYELTAVQKLFLFSRADTIYGGSNEIQRNVIAERVLGLPRDPA